MLTSLRIFSFYGGLFFTLCVLLGFFLGISRVANCCDAKTDEHCANHVRLNLPAVGNRIRERKPMNNTPSTVRNTKDKRHLKQNLISRTIDNVVAFCIVVGTMLLIPFVLLTIGYFGAYSIAYIFLCLLQ